MINNPYFTVGSGGNGHRSHAHRNGRFKHQSITLNLKDLKPVIGQMRFVNWCMSLIADKVAAGSGIYVGVLKEAGENIRSQLTSGQGPFTVIELGQTRDPAPNR